MEEVSGVGNLGKLGKSVSLYIKNISVRAPLIVTIGSLCVLEFMWRSVAENILLNGLLEANRL